MGSSDISCERPLPYLEAISQIVKCFDEHSVPTQVYLDGGVTLGTDVLKALALGARMVFVGRPVVWGLACDGQRGVEKVLQLLRTEFDMAMALAGINGVAKIQRDFVVLPKSVL